MSKAPPPRGGIAGLVLLFCCVAALIGLGFDMTRDPSGFWVGARPGGIAAIGAGAALFCVLAALAARFILGRSEKKGSDDAGVHP